MLNISIANIIFIVINLIVLFLLMKKFLIGPVTDIMEKRKALIEEQFSSASNAEKKALELKSQYEDSVKSISVRSDEMLESARKNAGEEFNRIINEADEKAGKIINDAEKTIRIEREKTLREMESEIAGIAMIAATKIVSEKSSDDRNKSIYDDFLKKAGDSNDADRD